MSDKSHILLLNCTTCDDILRLDEDHARSCLCGSASASWDRLGKRWAITGPGRILRIAFEEYDGAAPGVPKRWDVAPT